MGVVKAICISERKGTAKQEVPEVYLAENWGIEGDAHAGNWHRQVSLLAFEEIEDFRARGANVDFGAFGENLIVEGIGTPLKVLPVGTHPDRQEVPRSLRHLRRGRRLHHAQRRNLRPCAARRGTPAGSTHCNC